jgi:hypothetical protein
LLKTENEDLRLESYQIGLKRLRHYRLVIAYGQPLERLENHRPTLIDNRLLCKTKD